MAEHDAVENAVEALEASQPEQAPTDDDRPIDAVIVIKTVNEDGNLVTDVITNGGVQPTEVQTLLELGLIGWRKKIGLEA